MKLNLEISVLWSKIEKFYNNKILKKNFFEYSATFIWKFQYISVNNRFDFKQIINVSFFKCILFLCLSILLRTKEFSMCNFLCKIRYNLSHF